MEPLEGGPKPVTAAFDLDGMDVLWKPGLFTMELNTTPA